MNYTIDELKTELRKYLSEKRYEHSLLVMEEAQILALKYTSEDKKIIENTMKASLMHDIAKEMTKEQQEKYIIENNIDLDINNKENTPLIHGTIGADICKKYGFNDDMINAIKYHTTGRINMTIMDKIVFIADKIGRKSLSEEMMKIKTIANEDLDKSIYLYLDMKIKELMEKNINIPSISIQVKKDLYNKIKHKN